MKNTITRVLMNVVKCVIFPTEIAYTKIHLTVAVRALEDSLLRRSLQGRKITPPPLLRNLAITLY